MSTRKPFATPFLMALAVAALMSLTAASKVDAQQSPASDAAATKATPAQVQENYETVRERPAPAKVVVGKDGSKHAETGPAKPVETWMSACPPHGQQEQAAASKECRKSDDAGKPVKVQ
jgi:hypothetical protein